MKVLSGLADDYTVMMTG